MSWILPPNFSTYGDDIDRIYYIILWITGIVFVLTQVTLLYFLVKYRHQEGRKAEYIHGNVKAEVIWTAVPTVIVLGIALMSKPIWDQIRNPALIPDDAMEVIVTAKQFEWNVTYPGSDGQLGTNDDFDVRNQLHVPVDRAVVVLLRSDDVIHSFFLPDMRVKQDAVPGMETPVWFEATQAGEYPLACAELCGLGHYTMDARMTVHSADDFQAWQAEQIARVEGSNSRGTPADGGL